MECYNCHKLWHFQWECKKRVANFVETQAESDEEHMLMAYVEEKEKQKTNVWFLDSGCSNHMCEKKGIFFRD